MQAVHTVKGLRVLTAIFFGASSFLCVAHFHLLKFTGAAYLSAVFVWIGYWLISQKYEPVMHAFFFCVALFLLYKTVTLKQFTEATHLQDHVLNRLVIGAALIMDYTISHGILPSNLNQIPFLPQDDRDASWSLCSTNCAWVMPEPNKSPNGFWLRFESKNSRDNTPMLWYINETFEVYQKSLLDDGFVKIPLNSKT